MKIVDHKEYKNVGILVLNQSWLDEIAKRSGDLAKDNEYQVHYWAHVVKTTYDDNSELYVAIPTVFFNYPQEVSSAYIDFDLADVEEMSKKLEDLHYKMVNENRTEYESIRRSVDDLAFRKKRIEEFAIPFNSMHRHPGGSNQYFSSTDLSKNINKPGIVFPLLKANNQPNFASILIYNSFNKRVDVARTEFRLANNVNDDIHYNKNHCITVTNQDNVNEVESRFMDMEDKSILVVDSNKIKTITYHLKQNFHIPKWVEANFDFIDSDNLTKGNYSDFNENKKLHK